MNFTILRRTLFSLALVGASSLPLAAQATYAIRDAKIYTVSGSTIPSGTVVIRDGKIMDVGDKVSIPSGAKIINGRGLSVYPGIFDSDTTVGLGEIGAVPVTNDYSEIGDYQPQLLAFTAFHVESELIPVARVDGVTTVLARPQGSIISGQAAIMDLSGWSPEEMEVNRHGAMTLEFPSLLPLRRGFFGGRQNQQSQSQRKKEFDEKVRELKDLLAKARHYMSAKEEGAEVEPNRQLGALVPVVKGVMPVLIEANSQVDIKEAVKFGKEEKLNFVILGANDAWKLADFLKENEVRVILGPRQSLPVRDDDPIDIQYRVPAILHEKGVKFALSTNSASDVRTLPFEAGNAVAYGLPQEAGLRAITLSPAEFLGVADQLGSIEKGKRANLVVTDGDIFEYRTKIKHVFIDGADVPLVSKHTQLYEKYINRP